MWAYVHVESAAGIKYGYTAARNQFFSKSFHIWYTYQHLVENRNLHSILLEAF